VPLIALPGCLAVLSFAITLWQWIVGRRFPLHARIRGAGFAPPVTILKPQNGADAATRDCLESWFMLAYPGRVQLLFGVASPDDPVCPLLRQLIANHPGCDAELVICSEDLGPNAKVSTLAQLQRHARHEVVVISDADVRVAPDFLANVVDPLRDPAVGLVNCFYLLANPATPAMRWEAIAINADFWTQVLQARSLGPIDFALGAAMAVRKKDLESIGGFAALVDHLADDFQLGQRIVANGGAIIISPVVVECHEAPRGWRQVWRHQLRWARTIRVCRPLPYFFSILGNATLWPLLWLLTAALASPPPGGWSRLLTSLPFSALGCACFLAFRIWTANDNQARLTRSRDSRGWLVLLKDLLGAVLWAASFPGNRLEWRGRRYRVRGDGRLTRESINCWSTSAPGKTPVPEGCSARNWSDPRHPLSAGPTSLRRPVRATDKPDRPGR